MLVTPIPGADQGNILKALRSVHTSAVNLNGAGPQTAYSRLLSYLQWANESVRLLTSQIRARDIDRLIRTPMYQSLLDGVGHLAGSQQERLVNGLVALEVEQRTAALEEAVCELVQQMDHWPAGVAYLVLDTSFYIQHPMKLEDVDFAELAQSGDADIRILVPMAVIDELDGLKQQKSGHARWRAGYTLAVLDERLYRGRGVLHASERRGDLITLEVSGPGKVSLEVLFDAADHIRLPIMDDEIVDRARAVQAIANGFVALFTYDTGQAMRARNAGLLVRKLRTDAGTGPEPMKS